MMKINGYQLREAIKRLSLSRDAFLSQFKDSLYTFEKEQTNLSPIKLMYLLEKAEYQTAIVEEAQQKFNQIVTVSVQNETMTLARAVKLVGGAARREKLWKEVIVPKNRYGLLEPVMLTRNKDSEYAIPTISKEEALLQSHDASIFASSLRNAIAKGNNAEIERIGIKEEQFQNIFN
jgi:hypothetical protein